MRALPKEQEVPHQGVQLRVWNARVEVILSLVVTGLHPRRELRHVPPCCRGVWRAEDSGNLESQPATRLSQVKAEDLYSGHQFVSGLQIN